MAYCSAVPFSEIWFPVLPSWKEVLLGDTMQNTRYNWDGKRNLIKMRNLSREQTPRNEEKRWKSQHVFLNLCDLSLFPWFEGYWNKKISFCSILLAGEKAKSNINHNYFANLTDSHKCFWEHTKTPDKIYHLSFSRSRCQQDKNRAPVQAKVGVQPSLARKLRQERLKKRMFYWK